MTNNIETGKEMEFHRAMLDGVVETTKFGYYPRRFVGQLGNVGGVGAVKALLAKHRISDGFERLRRANRLDLSCEAYVIAPYYAELFTSDEIAWAKYQLREVGFDVDAYLAYIGQDAP